MSRRWAFIRRCYFRQARKVKDPGRRVAAFPQAPNAFDPEKTYPVEALKAELQLRPFLHYWTIETKKDPVMERALLFLKKGR